MLTQRQQRAKGMPGDSFQRAIFVIQKKSRSKIQTIIGFPLPCQKSFSVNLYFLLQMFKINIRFHALFLKGHGKKLLHSRQPGTRSSRTRAGTQDVVGLINKINILLLFIHV
jgi:hypothetical protein